MCVYTCESMCMVCECVCVHIWRWEHGRVYICVFVNVGKHSGMYVCMPALCTCMCESVYMWIFVTVWACRFVCVCTCECGCSHRHFQGFPGTQKIIHSFTFIAITPGPPHLSLIRHWDPSQNLSLAHSPSSSKSWRLCDHMPLIWGTRESQVRARPSLQLLWSRRLHRSPKLVGDHSNTPAYLTKAGE